MSFVTMYKFAHVCCCSAAQLAAFPALPTQGAVCIVMNISKSSDLQRWHCIAHLMQANVIIFLTGYIYGCLKGLSHDKLQQRQMHICQNLQQSMTCQGPAAAPHSHPNMCAIGIDGSAGAV